MAQPRAIARSSPEPSSIFIVGNFQELEAIFRTSGNCAWQPYENRRGRSHFLGQVGLAGSGGAAGSVVTRRRRSPRDVRPLDLVPEVDWVLPADQRGRVRPDPPGVHQAADAAPDPPVRELGAVRPPVRGLLRLGLRPDPCLTVHGSPSGSLPTAARGLRPFDTPSRKGRPQWADCMMIAIDVCSAHKLTRCLQLTRCWPVRPWLAWNG